MLSILKLVAIFIVIYLFCRVGWDLLFEIFFGKKK